MSGRFVPALVASLAFALTATATQAQGPTTALPSNFSRPAATPTPQARVRPGFITHVVPLDMPRQPYIAPPTHLQNTGDTNVCADHGGLAGAFACSEAFQQSWIVLVWDWQSPDFYFNPLQPNTQYTVVKDIEGFHAYQVVSDGHGGWQDQLVSTATGGPAATMTAFAPPAAATSQNCYMVRAFKGQLESPGSEPFCIGYGQQPTLTTISLAPSASRIIRHLHLHGLAFCGVPDIGFDTLFVGFVHCNEGPDQSQEVWRILTRFDLSSLGTVFSARLRFHRDVTALQGTDPSDNNQISNTPANEPLQGRTDANCATEILLPTYDWVTNGWDDSDPQGAPPVTDLPTVDFAAIPPYAADVDMDVTDQVLTWRMAPADNNGFALRTWDEYTSEEDNNWCVSAYRNFSLDVTEMPPSGTTLIDPGTIVVPGAP